MIDMPLRRYKNIYRDVLYKTLSTDYSIEGKVNEIQITKYPFHSGLRIVTTDGHKFINDIHCKNAFQAIRELKRLIRENENE